MFKKFLPCCGHRIGKQHVIITIAAIHCKCHPAYIGRHVLNKFPSKPVVSAALSENDCSARLMPFAEGHPHIIGNEETSPAGVLTSSIWCFCYLRCVLCFESKADTGGLADGKACFLPPCLDFRRIL